MHSASFDILQEGSKVIMVKSLVGLPQDLSVLSMVSTELRKISFQCSISSCSKGALIFEPANIGSFMKSNFSGQVDWFLLSLNSFY